MGKSFPTTHQWRLINDYLYGLCGLVDEPGFFGEMARGLQSLIPHDFGCALLTPSFETINISNDSMAALVQRYNHGYRNKNPSIRFAPDGSVLYSPDFVSWMDYRDCEFYADLIHPHRIGHNLGFQRPGYRNALMVIRSNKERGFSEGDVAVLEAVNPHCDRLISLREKLGRVPRSSLDSPESVRDRFPSLSRREAEVAAKLRSGLTAAEMAAVMKISVRTVECHLLHVYEKLDVRNKRQAIDKLDAVSGRPG